MKYPKVLGEYETLAEVAAGRSIARYGDGEFNLCAGHGIPCQRYHPKLSDRLKEILYPGGSGSCLVGIPNLHSDTPKMPFWRKYVKAATPFLGRRDYVSAFISRPDSAPWVDVPGYWVLLSSLWIDQDVTLVRGSGRSFTAADLHGAKSVKEIVSAPKDAWHYYDDLLRLIGRPQRVLLCLGPTATVMAVDLCALGVHAIDLGHAGMWWRKHVHGEPMIQTDADKIAT